MLGIFARRTLLVAAILISVLVLFLVCLAPWSTPVQRTADLRIAGPPQLTNGALVVNVVLSNGAPNSLNVVDDPAGNPHFILDAGAEYYPAGSRDHVVGLGPAANTLKLTLAPGASLTNSVSVTNPPSRFRLMAETRDLAAERRTGWLGPLAHVLPQRWSKGLERRLDMPMSTSEWIQIEMPEH